LSPTPQTKSISHQPLGTIALGLFYFPIQKGDTTMKHQDIIAHLCLKYPPEVIHSITTENIISAIVRRMGEEALELSSEDGLLPIIRTVLSEKIPFIV
jgi:hypothetical protein